MKHKIDIYLIIKIKSDKCTFRRVQSAIPHVLWILNISGNVAHVIITGIIRTDHGIKFVRGVALTRKESPMIIYIYVHAAILDMDTDK